VFSISRPRSPGSRPRRARGVTAVIAAALSALAMTACGTTAAGSQGGNGAATSGRMSGALQKKYDALFSGSFQAPPEKAPRAVRGKRVWIISCGRQFGVCTTIDREFQAAGKALGWQVTVFDSAGDSQKAIAGIRQAVAAHANAITTIANDCATIKSGLLAARNAKVPVVGYDGIDCGGEPLFAASVKMYGSSNILDYMAKRGTGSAILLAALLQKRGITNGKILEVKSLGQESHGAFWAAWEKEIKLDCPACKVVPVTFTNSQVPNPATQIWRTAVTANPDADALVFNSDAYLSLGLGAAIKAARNKKQVVCCGSGEDQPKYLKEGTVTAANVWPYEYDTWSLADTVNQLLAGVRAADLPNEGGGLVFVDADHNMPADGQKIAIPVPGFRAMREKAWSGS
jgi:ribose transport system substrate-binding protein